jgi:hypothetical protein
MLLVKGQRQDGAILPGLMLLRPEIGNYGRLASATKSP